ncbi:MAG: neutral zinc metallopeptidase [Pseudolabrys sp.]
MRWEDFRRSDNVEDSGGGGGGGGGGFGIPGGGGGLGIGAVVVLSLVGWALGIDPSILIGGAEVATGNRPSQYQQPSQPQRTGPQDDKMRQFIAAILGNTEDVWTDVFKQNGQRYKAPKLRRFYGQVQAKCGMASAASGPFYCPPDQHIYVDTSFFNDLQVRFKGCSGKACEFAEAYVIAHEVGHHVQNLLGILPKATAAQRAAGDKAAANRIQVRIELQADCFAGIWANQSNQRWKTIEPGDVEAAMQTAAAIGDDRLQKQARGYVVPDSFTHGSSAQRQRWFTIGLKEGKISSCNTFAASTL